MESGQWELGAKQCAPGAKRFDIATTTRVVDGDACVSARLEQQLLRALLARGSTSHVHIMSSPFRQLSPLCMPLSGGIFPKVCY